VNAAVQTTLPPRPTGLRRLFEPPRIGEMSPGGKVVVYTLLALWSLFVLFPLYWVVVTSLKLPIDVNAGPVYIPFVDFEPNLHAWRDLTVTGLGETIRPYINSIIIGACSTLLCVLIGSMAAYALARIEYRPKLGTILLFVVTMVSMAVAVGIWGVDWRIAAAVAVAVFVLLARALGRRFKRAVANGDILFWMISQRILPPVVVIIPIYMMFQRVHLLDTHIALILCYTVVNLPIVVWLMHDFFVSIPIDLEESAQLDGASRFTIFDIVLPLARAGLAATTLLVLILSWNEYVLALFLSTSNAQTMPILVAGMNAGEKGILWWTMCVVIIIMIVPVILMALVLQRFIAKGILLGAVKG
jgi:multiple sugar transport system permease protein